MKQLNDGKRLVAFLMALVMMLSIVIVPDTTYAAQQAERKVYLVRINRRQNCVTVYDKDSKGEYTVPVKAMACSVGVNGATPLGTFTMKEKYRWHTLMGDVYGQYCTRIQGGVLFHSVFYHSADPSTLYYNAYNRLGSTASHGCVRLCVADAKWIYDYCAPGTKINIYESSNPGPLGKPSPVRIDVNSKNRGWDPTDPDSRNPWPSSAPTMSGTANLTLERLSSSAELTKNVKATDYLGNSLKVTVSGRCDLNKVGTYRITYTATDARKKSVQKSVVVNVRDTVKPVIKTSYKNLKIDLDKWNFKSYTSLKLALRKFASATDSNQALDNARIQVDAADLYRAAKAGYGGNYSVKYTVKDLAGNESAASTIVVRTIPAKPVIKVENKSLKLTEKVNEKKQIIVTGAAIAVRGDKEEQFKIKDKQSLENYIKRLVSGTYAGKKITKSALKVDVKELYKAWKHQESGTYIVTVSAKGGTKTSDKITIKVRYKHAKVKAKVVKEKKKAAEETTENTEESTQPTEETTETPAEQQPTGETETPAAETTTETAAQ